MRRVLTIVGILIVGAALCGCSFGIDTEKIPMNIGFKPVIGHDTRAEESVPFPTDQSFRVWAVNTTNGNTVLNNDHIVYGANGWMTNYIWPEAELDFAAYWPIDLNPEFDKEKGIIIKNFGADDIDLLVAREKAVSESDSLVTLHFEHILSRVEFRIKHSLEDHIELILTKIELNGYGKNGNYNEKGSGFWELNTENEGKTIYDAGENPTLKLTKEAQYIGKDFYTIPQQCTGTATVYFRVKVGDGQWVPDKVTTKPLNTEWESGKQYTYTLNITDTKLAFTTGISNWNNRE